jgi:hypothetical protein
MTKVIGFDFSVWQPWLTDPPTIRAATQTRQISAAARWRAGQWRRVRATTSWFL